MSTHDRIVEHLPAAPPIPGQTSLLGEPPLEQLDLPELAARIRHHHEAARQHVDAADAHWNGAVDHAVHEGRALNVAKAKVPHGEWAPWLRDNFPGSERTARRYMQLAENGHAVADLPTVREAIAKLTKPKRPKPKPKPDKPRPGLDAQAQRFGFKQTEMRLGRGDDPEQIRRALRDRIDRGYTEALRAEERGK